jgi:ATP-dependent Clp protease ATP-binding subunit ClpB
MHVARLNMSLNHSHKQGGSMFDGSAILKPALARGQLRCLGCSSPDKFKKTIEKDPGLERRFQLVGVIGESGEVVCLWRHTGWHNKPRLRPMPLTPHALCLTLSAPHPHTPQVMVDQPSVDAATSILRGLRPRYERHHGVTISEAALLAASRLSARYISGRQLPDKAIDCLDEAAAQVGVSVCLLVEVGSQIQPDEPAAVRHALILQHTHVDTTHQ